MNQIRSYTRYIDGYRVTFTWYPNARLWGAIIHGNRGMLPGADGPTYQIAERNTRALIRKSKPFN